MRLGVTSLFRKHTIDYYVGMEVVLFYILIAVSAISIYRNRHKTDVGVLTTASGKKYPYAIGNYLKSESSSFHGLEITLPYSLANFYLDSHKDSRRKGPAALYATSQKVSLEGNFNKYFQLFVPPNNATFVLSILSPDVMHTLMTSSQRYDVELSGNYLRIISHKKTNARTESSLLAAAKAIVEELDHRAKSWQHNAQPPTKLLYRRGTAVKLAGLYFRRSRLLASVAAILLAITATGLGLAYFYTRQDLTFSDPYSKGVFAGTMMYAAQAIILTTIAVVMLGPLIWFFALGRRKDSSFKE